METLQYPIFFSSRRRHTRFDCDWSSDVCSSDLDEQARGDDAGPGGDARQAQSGAVGGAIEMTRAARERLQDRRAIVDILRVENERGISRPEQDAASPQIGAPGGFADDARVAIEPLAGQILG